MSPSRLATLFVVLVLIGAIIVLSIDRTRTAEASNAAQARMGGADTGYVVAPSDSAAGAYLTIVGGCNDCHTADWMQNRGRTPPAERLTGSPVGFRGSWGTSYPTNLRLLPRNMTENEWVEVLRTADHGRGRPPMPWVNTAQMADRDLRNLYRYIRALGPRGEMMPRAVPPGEEPTTPYILFEQQEPGMPPGPPPGLPPGR